MNTWNHEHIVRLQIVAENELYGSKTFFLYQFFALIPILTELKRETALNAQNHNMIFMKKSPPARSA